MWTVLYILGLLLLLEAGARITWRVIDASWGLVVPQDISRFDDIYGWALTPGARSVSKATGRPILYAVNSRGIRGPEIPFEKPRGTYRIMLLGDSHTFGFGVPSEDHFSSLLEGYLPGSQVVNMGVNGYGIDQELLYLTREGFKYHPDMVMAYVPHYADLRHLRDFIWGMGKPVYRLEAGRLVLTNSPVTNNAPLYVAAINLDRFLSHWSRAYQLARDTVIHFVVTRERVLGEEDEFKAAMPEAERMAAAIIDEMAAQSARHGAQFVLVTLMEDLARHAKARGIPCLFITDSLNNPRLTLSTDPTRHPNEAASGIIAWQIAEFLKANALGPSGP